MATHYRHVLGGKKGWFCYLVGAGAKKGVTQPEFSVSSQKLSLCCLADRADAVGRAGVSLAWAHGLRECYQERVVCKQPVWNAWGCKRKVISGSTEL